MSPAAGRLTWLLGALLGAAVTFLATGNYARKVTVPGFLLPTVGVAKVFPPHAGLVTALDVHEGQVVAQGAPLLTVQVGETDGQGGDVDAAILQALSRQRDTLIEQIRLEQSKTAEEQTRLRDQIAGLEQEATALQAQLATQHMRTLLAAQQVAAVRDLVAAGYVSDVEFKRRQDNHLAQRQNEAALGQQITEKHGQAMQQGHALAALPDQLAGRLLTLRQSVADLEGKLAETSGHRAYQLRAPVAGRISALQARVGLVADPAIPQLAIVPTGGVLEAELLVPARAIGFVTPGRSVRIAYEAFPYQRFGMHGGKVRSVSSTLLRPAELVGPIPTNEPSYPVIVTLDQQTIPAFGKQFPLDADMALKASIVLDRRSLLDWVLEPLYTLRGRAT